MRNLSPEDIERLKHVANAIDLLIDMAKERKAGAAKATAKAVCRYVDRKSTKEEREKQYKYIFYSAGKFNAWNELQETFENAVDASGVKDQLECAERSNHV